ncbi:serine proteinase stubble [Caerostris extrusa]|uniref:Serine proteinase stubble n=1 Tax=Caerostris extrusa TaxID=172846 RepID=A0AAV4N9H3_CAEEX|nr:serine proteinase stubble [Caerostris extrusa]
MRNRSGLHPVGWQHVRPTPLRGVILKKLWVLTAAHCVTSYSARHFTVRVGEYDLTKPETDHIEKDYSVEKIHLHPDLYRPKRYNNDIALLKLHKPIEYNGYSWPTCLPDNDDDFSGQEGTVIGWGFMKENVASRILSDWNDLMTSYFPPYLHRDNPYLPVYLNRDNPYFPAQYQQNNPYLAAYLHQDNPYLRAYLHQDNPYLPVYLNRDNPYFPAQYQQNNPYLAAYLHQDNPYLRAYLHQDNPYLPVYLNRDNPYFPAQYQQNNPYLAAYFASRQSISSCIFASRQPLSCCIFASRAILIFL